MSHIDPETYDPAKLVGDERLVMDGFEACERAVSEAMAAYIDMVGADNPETIGKMLSEVADSVRDFVLCDVESAKLSLSCALMESNLDTYGEDAD